MFSNRFVIFIILVYVGINLSGLFVPLVVNASKYAQVGREIIDNNDWVNLTIAHEAYDQKPPFLFWLSAVSYSIFGFSLLAFKIPVLLLSLIGIYSTFKLGTFLYGTRVGKIAAFFWATSLGYFYFHNDIHTDTVLVNFVILAIWQLTAFFKYKKWHQFSIGVIAIGFAMLAKGPVGLVIPAFALGTHLLAQKKYKEIFHPRWLLATILVFLIITPALLGLYKQFGIEGIKFFFWTNNVGRVTGSYRASSTDLTFYFHNLILLTSPWFVFVYTGLILEIRKFILKIFRKENLKESDELINLGGFVLFFIVLTIAKQKNPHYMMAILPFVMILAAKWMVEIFETKLFQKVKKIVTVINQIYPYFIFPLILLFLLWFYPENRIWFWMLFIATSLGFIFTLFKIRNLKKQLVLLLIAQFIFFISLNLSILPSMLDYYSPFKACKIFNEQALENEKLHSYRLRNWSLFTNSKNYGEWVRDDDKLKEIIAQDGTWIYTDEPGLNVLNKWEIKYEIKGEFNNRNITGQSIGFLNPKTREGKLQKHYLVKLD
ncbi:MAG: glycosyltransferase family 39 protein [Mariniphaga sp.]|nr:glycosyltransferase family 39 protein [Mariniphaga sp.]